MNKQIGQNMMLVNSTFRNVKSFTLIPISIDSPYTEAMFDPTSGILAVISKIMKQSYHMIPKLNDDGEPIKLKSPNPQTGKIIKEERRLVDTFSEFYLTDKTDINTFIQTFAINEKSFDYKTFFIDVKETKTSNLILTAE